LIVEAPQRYDTYLADKKAPNNNNAPPVIGKYNGIDKSRNEPTSKAKLIPHTTPGNKVGSNTPNDIPTKADDNDNTYSTTIARSNPTGTNNGSKNTYVTNPDNNPDNIPEKYRVSL
jgi:hypothetical protein